MEYLKINYEEVSALRGLPHMQQLLYIFGIKPFVDYRSGVVGIKRKISYQSLSEVLYIEPHSGIQSGSPSKAQLRRALKSLERAGLITIQSDDFSLILHCLYVSSGQSVSNKPVIKPSQETVQGISSEVDLKSTTYKNLEAKPIIAKLAEPVIPLGSNNNYLFLLSQQFEKFWNIYPLKKSKQKTWEQFQSMQPTDALVKCILVALEKQVTTYNTLSAKGQWLPGWKFPANWLAQHCWEDEINMDALQESTHANDQKRNTATQPVDLFWDSCKGGADFINSDSNIVNIGGFRKAETTY